jgi:hypothetical protein
MEKSQKTGFQSNEGAHLTSQQHTKLFCNAYTAALFVRKFCSRTCHFFLNGRVSRQKTLQMRLFVPFMLVCITLGKNYAADDTSQFFEGDSALHDSFVQIINKTEG